MQPCKHLDYESEYTDCQIKTCEPHYPEVKYWERGERWVKNLPGEKDNPRNVQFCKLRGRINSIFDCYQPGEMSCYEADGGSG